MIYQNIEINKQAYGEATFVDFLKITRYQSNYEEWFAKQLIFKNETNGCIQQSSVYLNFQPYVSWWNSKHSVYYGYIMRNQNEVVINFLSKDLISR